MRHARRRARIVVAPLLLFFAFASNSMIPAFASCWARAAAARVGYRYGYVHTTSTMRASHPLLLQRQQQARPHALRLRRCLTSISASASASAAEHHPRLDLVFDINKTIVLEDPAGGKDVRALLNEIVSELAWGRVEDGGRRWASVGLPLSIDPPTTEPPSWLVSYSSFVHDMHPDVAGGDLKAIKARRDGLKGTFTEAGGPGHAYAGDVEALDAALRLSPQLDPKLLAAAGLGGRERVVLLPAFLHFLLTLQASYPPDRFAVQFRTFGDDLPRVANEFNALCRGLHPLFPGQAFGGGDGGRDHSLDLEGDGECFGCMYRDAQGPVMILGTFQQPTSRADVAEFRARGHRVLESVQEMHAFIRGKQASARPTLAIRDYWPWWRQNLEEGSAGKLVLVDNDVMTVALDDNIERTRSHIIDLREARTGTAIPFEDGVGRGHLVRAEPYLALRDPEGLFWGVLQACLEKWKRTAQGKDGDGRAGPAAGA